MLDRSYKLNFKSSARNLFKSIPGLTGAIRRLHKLDKKLKTTFISKVLAWSRASPTRRAITYDGILDELTLAYHENESYVIRTRDRYIGRGLYSRGEFDFSKFVKAYRILQSHRNLTHELTLIDAGANVGSICIPAVRRGFVSNAIAIELDHENARLLSINTLLNRVENNIRVMNVAVGSAPGQVSVRHSKTNFGDHRVGTKSSRFAKEMIPMITLDSVTDTIDSSRLLVWMDIQGYEGYALAGAKRLIAAGVPLATEFSVEELEKFGCYELFLSIISSSCYKVYFDLSIEVPLPISVSEESLRSLGNSLLRKRTFTDLLFLQ